MRDSNGRYAKGHTESIEEKKKRISCMTEAWKQREDYIRDIVSECPYIYNVWRGLMFTKKGQKQGICDKWKDYRNFYNDVRPTYVGGYVFRRIDVHKPYSTENFTWLPQVLASITKDNLVRIEYNGEILTFREIEEKYNPHHYNAIKLRYYRREEKNYTIEEIIFGRKKKRGTKKSHDVEEDKIRAKASKMISSYKIKDSKMGLDVCNITIDWMIKNIINKPCFYCGDTHRVGCDRIDNNKGHTIDNVVPCCIECNTARNNHFSVEEMMTIGAAIREVKQKRKLASIENKPSKQ